MNTINVIASFFTKGNHSYLSDSAFHRIHSDYVIYCCLLSRPNEVDLKCPSVRLSTIISLISVKFGM